MMHIPTRTACLVPALLVALGASTIYGDRSEPVALSKVPKNIAEAVEKALPGFNISRVETEIEDGKQVFEVTGTAGGQKYELEISTSGKLLEMEKKGSASGDKNSSSDDDSSDDDSSDDPDSSGSSPSSR